MVCCGSCFPLVHLSFILLWRYFTQHLLCKNGGAFDTNERGFEYTYQFIIPVFALGILLYYTEEKPFKSVYVLVLVEALVIALGGGDWMLWGRMLVPLWLCWWICFPKLELKNPKHILLLTVSIWGIWPLLISYKALQVAFDGRKIPVAGYQEGSLSEMSQEQAQFIQAFVDSKQMDSGNIMIAMSTMLVFCRFI